MSEQQRNEFGQPIGAPLPGWSPRPLPPRTAMSGRFCRVEPLDPERHAADLFAANAEDAEGRNWTYLPYGPFRDVRGVTATGSTAACRARRPAGPRDRRPGSGRAVGVASLMRIDAGGRASIEVGGINYSPRLQRRPAATEAMYLMMRRVFDELGYRRYEWKCDSLNAPSRAAAQRLGFRYEGLFRQATVYKGRNRDTAWFSILDSEWPALARPRSSAGSTRPISTPTAASAPASRACGMWQAPVRPPFPISAAASGRHRHRGPKFGCRGSRNAGQPRYRKTGGRDYRGTVDQAHVVCPNGRAVVVAAGAGQPEALRRRFRTVSPNRMSANVG